MAIGGILGAIGLIIHGIGTVAGTTWKVTKDLVGWLFHVMPPMMKFFFFLYFIIFLIGTIIPVFLGTGFQCTTDGETYKMDFVEVNQKIGYVEDLAEVCAQQNLNVPDNEQEWSLFGGISAVTSELVSFFRVTFLSTERVWDVSSSVKTRK